MYVPNQYHQSSERRRFLNFDESSLTVDALVFPVFIDELVVLETAQIVHVVPCAGDTAFGTVSKEVVEEEQGLKQKQNSKIKFS